MNSIKIGIEIEIEITSGRLNTCKRSAAWKTYLYLGCEIVIVIVIVVLVLVFNF